MTHFVKVNGSKEIKSIKMHGTSRKRLHLVDAGGKQQDIQIKSSKDSVITAKLVALYNGPKGIWTVDFTSHSLGQATVEVKIKGKVSTTLNISVVEKLKLPAADSNEGLLARLFLAESRTPGQTGYDADKAKQAMQWMRLVIVNRLNNKPEQFAAPGAKTIHDIVKAKGQFKGFENYPTLDARVHNRINEILRIANADDDSRQQRFEDFVNYALTVAKASSVIKDPSPNGLYGWRTEGHGSPGSRFEKFKSAISGNQFYTLKKETP